MPEKVIISKDFLEEFFKILFFHIGYSQYYERYVIVEPVCTITCTDKRITFCKSVDFLIDDFHNIGFIAA